MIAVHQASYGTSAKKPGLRDRLEQRSIYLNGRINLVRYRLRRPRQVDRVDPYDRILNTVVSLRVKAMLLRWRLELHLWAFVHFVATLIGSPVRRWYGWLTKGWFRTP